ncbi:MAG: phosphate acetyltransferase [Clostridia bacterium]
MNKFERGLLAKAKALHKTLVFPEAAFSTRTVNACKFLAKKKIAKVILIGDESALMLSHKRLDKCVIINPKTSVHKDELASELYELRKGKGLTMEEANRLILDPFYFSTMLLNKGLVDGIVAGAESPTATTLRPALQIIKAKEKGGLISSCFVMTGKNKMLGKNPAILLADCGVNISPTSEELAKICSSTIETSIKLGLNVPKVAFVSFSTLGSASGIEVEKVQKAVAIATEKHPDLIVEGEMQIDAAMVKSVAETKAPKSRLKGEANILIFPDLQSGNIAYKIMQRFGNLNAYGPIIQNLKKPVNDLSRGCTVEEIEIVAAITALQCDSKGEEK